MAQAIDFSEVKGLKDFKILGYTTDFNQCECCGKEGLKGTVSILDLNTDVVMHYGTTCAASADKYDTFDAMKKAKKDIDSAVRDYQNTIRSACGFAWRYIRSIYGKYANCETVCKNIWEPIVADFEAFYTNPANKGKAHPILKQFINRKIRLTDEGCMPETIKVLTKELAGSLKTGAV